jgi:hemerythrin-like domain-containing protein
VALYPAHIWKEDYLLFPMADKILSPSDHELLLREFDVAEETIGTGAHETFEQLANELSIRIDHCPQCDQVAKRA